MSGVSPLGSQSERAVDELPPEVTGAGGSSASSPPPASEPDSNAAEPFASWQTWDSPSTPTYSPAGPTVSAATLTAASFPQPSTVVGTKGDLINSATVAQYKGGPPQRPVIHHDNGFLQNPADENDPKPIPTRSPSIEDYARFAEWQAILDVAKKAQDVPLAPHNDLPDALPAYEHFLYAQGEDRSFSYERFVSQDPAGQAILASATLDIQTAAEAYYQQLISEDPSLAGKPITFRLTGSAISVGNGKPPGFPYPETENWQKALGAHKIWMSGTVTVEPPTSPGGKPTFSMDMALHAEDKYNFNPKAKDIATGRKDAENGVLEQSGLGHQYMHHSSLERAVHWNGGGPKDGTSSTRGQDGRRE